MEQLAVILTLLSVLLTTRSHILCWPCSIAACLVYAYVFFQEHFYFQFYLQFLFIFQSIQGWYHWKKNNDSTPKFYSFDNFILSLAGVFFLFIILLSILDNNINSKQISLDILTTLLSILGMWYLAIKNIFGWLVWIIADIFFILMFLTQKMYWSTGLYLILLILAIKGLITWTKSIKTV